MKWYLGAIDDGNGNAVCIHRQWTGYLAYTTLAEISAHLLKHSSFSVSFRLGLFNTRRPGLAYVLGTIVLFAFALQYRGKQQAAIGSVVPVDQKA